MAIARPHGPEGGAIVNYGHHADERDTPGYYEDRHERVYSRGHKNTEPCPYVLPPQPRGRLNISQMFNYAALPGWAGELPPEESLVTCQAADGDNFDEPEPTPGPAPRPVYDWFTPPDDLYEPLTDAEVETIKSFPDPIVPEPATPEPEPGMQVQHVGKGKGGSYTSYRHPEGTDAEDDPRVIVLSIPMHEREATLKAFETLANFVLSELPWVRPTLVTWIGQQIDRRGVQESLVSLVKTNLGDRRVRFTAADSVRRETLASGLRLHLPPLCDARPLTRHQAAVAARAVARG